MGAVAECYPEDEETAIALQNAFSLCIIEKLSVAGSTTSRRMLQAIFSDSAAAETGLSHTASLDSMASK